MKNWFSLVEKDFPVFMGNLRGNFIPLSLHFILDLPLQSYHIPVILIQCSSRIHGLQCFGIP